MNAALLMLASGIGIGTVVGIVIGLALRPRTVAPIVWPASAPAEPPPELAAALHMVAVRDTHIAVLQSLVLVPPSPWSILPWQSVPDPVVQSREQQLMDQNADLRSEVATLELALTVSERRRALHWGSLKRLRLAVKRMVHVQELGVTEALRMRSLTVAKTAQSRAAELSHAISEVEVLLAEAQTPDELMQEFYEITRHTMTGSY